MAWKIKALLLFIGSATGGLGANLVVLGDPNLKVVGGILLAISAAVLSAEQVLEQQGLIELRGLLSRKR